MRVKNPIKQTEYVQSRNEMRTSKLCLEYNDQYQQY